jgi:hypothetical protein
MPYHEPYGRVCRSLAMKLSLPYGRVPIFHDETLLYSGQQLLHLNGLGLRSATALVGHVAWPLGGGPGDRGGGRGGGGNAARGGR